MKRKDRRPPRRGADPEKGLMQKVMKMKGIGPPGYCRRCRSGTPKALFPITAHGITIGKFCKRCMDEIAEGGRISRD